MADEPEEPKDGPVETEDQGAAAEAAVSVLAELALCENLSQTSGWAARWSATMSGAEATLLWAPDTVNPLFLCIGASGEGVETFLRRSAPRETGVVHDLVRDRHVLVLTGTELQSADPFVRGLPSSFRACLAVPLEAEGLVVGLLALFFTEMPDADEALARLERFLEHAAPALGRALRAERKTVGMLHAIERLTNLYDLTKAFGSTIDLDELSTIIARKAADFASAEVASLWMLEGGEVTLAATAVNENYDVESPPDAVGASVVGDVLADQAALRRNRVPERIRSPPKPRATRSTRSSPSPLVEDEVSVGALVVVNKRGRHPEFTAADEELLVDLVPAGRPRPAQRAPVRGREEGRGARRSPRRQPRDHGDARPRQGHGDDRQRDRRADPVRPLRASRSSRRASCGSARSPGPWRSTGRTRPSGGRRSFWSGSSSSGTDVAVTQPEDGDDHDRPPGDRGEVPGLLRGERDRARSTAFSSRTRRASSASSGSSATSPSCSTRRRATCCRSSSTRPRSPSATPSSTSRSRSPASSGRSPRGRGSSSRSRSGGGRRGASGRPPSSSSSSSFPWHIRVDGPVRVLPVAGPPSPPPSTGSSRRSSTARATASQAGEVVATLRDEAYRAALAEARAASRSPRATWRATAEGDAAAMFQATVAARRAAGAGARSPRSNSGKTRSARPTAGVIVTPRLEERVGQALARRRGVRVVADVGSRHRRGGRSRVGRRAPPAGQPVALKLNSFPTRVFRGTVARVGAEVRQEGEESFVIAEARVENADALAEARHAGNGQGLDRDPPPRLRAAPQAGALPLAQALAAAAVSARPGAAALVSAAPSRRASRPSRPATARAARPARAQDEPRHPPPGADRRRPVGRQEPRDDALLHLRRGHVGAHRALRRHADPGGDPGRLQAAIPGTRSSPLSSSSTRRCSARWTSSSSPRPRTTSRCSRGSRTARRRTAEQKAEGFNILYILFNVFDPEHVPDPDPEYVRWIWRPPPVVVVARLLRLTIGVFVTRFDTIWGQTLELYAFLKKPFWDFVQFFVILTCIGSIHEFAHGYVTKMYGGEVHDIGGSPSSTSCPPSTATRPTRSSSRASGSSSGSRRRDLHRGDHLHASRPRSGWPSYPDTLLHELAYKMMLFTGVSTIFFNINPLVKIDGYYALSSFLEIPELREESFAYIGALFQRHVLRLNVEVPVAVAPQEADLPDLRAARPRLSRPHHALHRRAPRQLLLEASPDFAVVLLLLTLYFFFRKRVRRRPADLPPLLPRQEGVPHVAASPLALLGAAGALVVFAVPWAPWYPRRPRRS